MQRYQLLNQNQIEMIHENSLKILNEVGMVLPYGPAKELLAKHGCKVSGDLVKFPPKLVEESMKLVPSSFMVHARNPEKSFMVDCENTIYAGPSGSPFVTDLDNGRRKSTKEDFEKIVKLLDANDNISILGLTSCEMNDIPIAERPNLMAFLSMKHCDKPIMATSTGYEECKNCIELASIPFGGLEAVKDKVILVTIPCSLTPLSYDEKQLGGIMAYAELGQAQLINSLGIGGLTSPATIAGLLSVQNAEILGGITLAQCVRPGAPCIYSAAGTSADMHVSSVATGAPEAEIVALCNAQLAHFYNIPVRNAGALTDSKLMDTQAALESALTLTMGEMSGGNFILHGVGIIESYNTLSFEKLIIDNEIIGHLKRIHRGIEVNEETLAFEVIEDVGPRGTFLPEEHTVEHFKQEFYNTKLCSRNSFSMWELDGSKSLEQVANEEWKKILAHAPASKLPSDIERDMLKFMEIQQ
jgi:trimethylamine--corrinoid protein Co-methyltransferase